MSWDTQLAKEFRKRENPKSIGACVGTVASVKPFVGSILDGQCILDSSNTYVCNSILERNSKYTLTGVYDESGNILINNGTFQNYKSNGQININGEIQLKEVLQVGDMVLVIPAADGQSFFVIDIIKGVE